jgi:hypothetical protein
MIDRSCRLRVRIGVARCTCPLLVGAALLASSLPATLFGFGVRYDSLFGSGIAQRWNAAPLTLDNGNERSLDGGLRYSVEGGSYGAFKNEFDWQGNVPTDADFQQAIEQAFAAWTAVDPATGLRTELEFIPDLDVDVTLDEQITGAEIDLFGQPIGTGFQGLATTSARGPLDMTLTSGAVFRDTLVFTGSQVVLNTNAANWTLDIFRTTLMHELGHVLGLEDVETAGVNGEFFDDDFDPTNSQSINATLTNSFALLIDPADPENSPDLSRFTLDPAQFDAGIPGGNSFAPHLLMESGGDPNVWYSGLDADSFAGRQFLYPHVSTGGDFNANGTLDVADVNLLMNRIAAGQFDEQFDVNADQVLDEDDLGIWVRTLKRTYFGDANLDGQFTTSDMVSVLTAGQYEDASPNNSNWATGDWNADGDFTSADLVVALSDGGYEQGPRPAAVPEPAGRLLATLAAFLLALARGPRRR